jgi:predicted nuclease of predicted toxin-antitoxin system
MKFLLDHDVYAATARFLRNLGHEVITVAQVGLAQGEDEDLLKFAEQLSRIFVTRDRDYGALVFLRKIGAGVLYLRMLPTTQQSVHNELERVLSTYSESDLMKAFVVIEPGMHRVRTHR